MLIIRQCTLYRWHNQALRCVPGWAKRARVNRRIKHLAFGRLILLHSQHTFSSCCDTSGLAWHDGRNKNATIVQDACNKSNKQQTSRRRWKNAISARKAQFVFNCRALLCYAQAGIACAVQGAPTFAKIRRILAISLF